ncbi:hypothetical protein [Phaeacidiphilus oryzae]|uniref:hypothetical protein n=1 Tax=Phaeacidiphilus oryzae TaxID=348818 RepID=UPI000565B615|nr:hypothetical protein [Phaeacidiphilus oryzae]
MSTEHESADEARVRPFADFLIEQAGGRTHTELSEQLHDLISAVTATGKGGALTLRVEVKPLTPGDATTLTVTDKVTVKIPQGDRPKSVFFVTGDGNLSRNDPRQLAFESLREVPTTTAPTELKKAN